MERERNKEGQVGRGGIKERDGRQELVGDREAGRAAPQLSLPPLWATSPSRRVYRPDVTFHPSTLARLALENVPPPHSSGFI